MRVQVASILSGANLWRSADSIKAASNSAKPRLAQRADVDTSSCQHSSGNNRPDCDSPLVPESAR
jgi:hypothetical protein